MNDRQLIQSTTEPASTQLTTLAKLAGELSLDAADPRLSDLLDQASDAVSGYCGRDFAAVTVTELFVIDSPMDSSYRRSLVFSRRPVTEIVSVTEDGTALDPTLFDLDAKAGILYRLEQIYGQANSPVDSRPWRWQWFGHRVVVVYKAGYLLPNDTDRNLPADIERACLDTAKSIFYGLGRDFGIKSESTTGVGSITFADPGVCGGVPPNAQGMLAGYRDYDA